MTEIELPKVPAEISAEALFRHRIVAAVLALQLLGNNRASAVSITVQCVHVTETGAVRSVSARTLYRWIASYAKGGIAALEPEARKVRTTALSDSLVAFLRKEKTDDPDASIPEILRRAREQDILAAQERVHRATAWRVAGRLGLPLTCRSAKALTDMRRFAYPHRMRMVLVDGKHFRAGVARLKRLVFFFIDDCTRRVIGLVVGASENSALLLRGLFELIRQVGKMDVLYFDRGPGFIANDTHAVCVRLDICFIHGRERYPEGHGKVEAFNKTAKHDVLRGLTRADVDPDFGSLELRLRHYVEHQYNVRPHESLDGQSPLQRWDADERELVFPRDHDELRSRFVLTESRRVSADNIVSVDGVHYEAPIGHARKSIPVERHLLTHTVWIVHDGRLMQLHPVDLAHNAEDRRGRSDNSTQETCEAPQTAAAMAFAKDFAPVPALQSPGPSRPRKPRKDAP
jgi:transposase InsO family protein